MFDAIKFKFSAYLAVAAGILAPAGVLASQSKNADSDSRIREKVVRTHEKRSLPLSAEERRILSAREGDSLGGGLSAK